MSARALIGAGGQRVFGTKMKKCSKCGAIKAVSEFHTRKDSRDGLRGECKLCSRTRMKEWVKNNPQRSREYHSEYRRKNIERVREQGRLRSKIYHANNRDKRVAYLKAKRLKVLTRPPWCINEPYADHIASVYAASRERTKITGILHHVDHIVPINHPLVCGLHVPWNLQVLTQFENDSKGNKWHPWWSE